MCCVPVTRARRAGGCQEGALRASGEVLSHSGLDLDLKRGDEARTDEVRERLIRRLERFQRAELLQRRAVCYKSGYVVKASKWRQC
jgi:hypothetical protein